ncbi:hypothetical protein C5C18_12445 [Rathayibacter tritici]|nr:hypothetical protein C5C21_12905 [Rathayibacter tritici]PPG05709.1 hypothetical protein C5C18_12445 [Rathayibacter tritici]
MTTGSADSRERRLREPHQRRLVADERAEGDQARALEHDHRRGRVRRRISRPVQRLVAEVDRLGGTRLLLFHQRGGRGSGGRTQGQRGGVARYCPRAGSGQGGVGHEARRQLERCGDRVQRQDRGAVECLVDENGSGRRHGGLGSGIGRRRLLHGGRCGNVHLRVARDVDRGG